ncbi:MAG: DUF5693 family protein [Candidatus Heteroscillospira sp.]
MKSWLKSNRLTALALVLGLICTLILCSVRAGLEAGHTGVSLIMSREDVAALAADSGMDADEYADRLLQNGLTAVFTPGEVCGELNLYIGDSYHGEDAVVGMCEDDRQYSHDEIEGFAYADGAEAVRVFRLRPEYAARYASLGYEGPEEITNLIYRTITDRNIRVIWLTPFTRADNGETVSDIAAYCTVIQDLGVRIQGQGLHLGQFSVLPPYSPNPILLCGVIAGLAAAGCLLLTLLISPLRKRLDILTLVCAAAGCLIHFRLPWLMPLCAALVYPCLASALMAELLVRLRPVGRGRLCLGFLSILLAVFAAALLGGSVVGALQSDRAYMLAVRNFRGVKLSQLLPLVFAAIYCLRRFYRGSSLRETAGEYLDSRLALCALAALAALGALYIARTGDGMLSAGVYEQRFRNALENALIVRPRTKEFLAAWPALAMAAVLYTRGSRRFALPFAVLSAVGSASVVNTFCHSRSPLWLALTRSALGLAIGFLLGCALILLFAPRRKKE